MDSAAKVLVDTSVWIDFLRGEGESVKSLSSLMKSERIVVCGQIVQEVLQGSRDEKAFAKLERQMAIWESKQEESVDFVEAARILAQLRWRGVTIPPTDCLIAAVAIRLKLELYAHDSDFDDIPDLRRYKASVHQK